MDICSSSWYALSGIFFTVLYWIVALGVQLQCFMCHELFIWYKPFTWSPPPVVLWAVGFVEQVAEQEVEETDVFCYRCLAGHVQLVTWYLFHWVMYFIVWIAWLRTNVYELNSARGEGLHILYPPWLFPFDVCNSVFSGYIEAPHMAGRLRFTRSFGPRSTLGSMVDNMKLFFAGLFSMDIRSSSWYALSGIFFSGLYWIVALGVQLQCFMCRELFIWYKPFAWSPPPPAGSLWAVGFVEQVADQEVGETDIFCYRCLNGQVQLVSWYLFHWLTYFIVRLA